MTVYRGGMKDSGIGRENGVEAFLACTLLSKSALLISKLLNWNLDSQSKSIIINTSEPARSKTSEDWFAEGGEIKRYG